MDKELYNDNVAMVLNALIEQLKQISKTANALVCLISDREKFKKAIKN